MMKNKGLKEPNPSRRKFLAAAKYSAVVAVLGLSRVRQVKGSTAEFTGVEKVRFDLLQHAIETGNMESALKKFGAASQPDADDDQGSAWPDFSRLNKLEINPGQIGAFRRPFRHKVVIKSNPIWESRLSICLFPRQRSPRSD